MYEDCPKKVVDQAYIIHYFQERNDNFLVLSNDTNYRVLGGMIHQDFIYRFV
jgi:hypothetical protein